MKILDTDIGFTSHVWVLTQDMTLQSNTALFGLCFVSSCGTHYADNLPATSDLCQIILKN